MFKGATFNDHNPSDISRFLGILLGMRHDETDKSQSFQIVRIRSCGQVCAGWMFFCSADEMLKRVDAGKFNK